MSWLWTTLGLAAVVGSALASTHLLLRYRSPAAAVGWLFTLWVLPFLGVLAYLAFGVYEGPRRIRRRHERSRRLRREQGRAGSLERGARTGSRGDDDEADSVDGAHPSHAHSPRARVAAAVCPFPPLGGNHLAIHPSGRAAREDVMQLVRGARHEVLLMTYSWGDDDLTHELVDAFAERVAHGVRVQVVLDAIGSIVHKGGALERLRAAGAEAAEFLAPSPLKGRFQVNFRNHRKLLVVDGAVAVVGGRNYGADYFDDGPDGIRDLSVRVEGPAVAAIRELFLEDWLVATDDEATSLPDCDVPQRAGTHELRVVPHGCDEQGESYLALLGAAFAEARTDILVVSPYFVPGDVMLHQLRLAALRGVRVRVLMAETSPERWPDLAARRSFGPLLELGAEIWLREPPFLHAKAVVVDGNWSIFGSANFDQRSFHLNYEVCFEVPGEAFAASLVEYFDAELAQASRVDPEAFEARRWHRRALENAAALLEPLL